MQRRVVSGFLVVGAAHIAGCVAQPDLQGPMPVRNQHPAQLTVLHLPPAAAAMLPAGDVQVRLDSAYSSLFLLGSEGNRSWLMDGEYLRVGTGIRVGLGAGVELATEIPVAHTSGGFLDGFVIDYHDLFGLPDQGRDSYPKDEYRVEAVRGNTTVWEVERDGFELLDVPLYASVALLPTGTERLGVAARGGIELPTGDDERGYGNGEVDASLGIVLDYRLDAMALYGHVQHTFAGTPDRTQRSGLEFADVTSLGGAAELPLASDLHAFLQVEWERSTLRNFGLPVTDRDQLLFWVGCRWQTTAALGVEVGFGEDLQGLASPDFTAWLGMVWNPRGRAAP